MTIGQRMKRAAKAKGISMSALAKRIGVHSDTTSDWSRDVRKPPLDALVAIADELEIPLTDLVPNFTAADQLEDSQTTVLGLADIVGLDKAADLLAAEIAAKVRRSVKAKADPDRHATN